MIYIFLEGVLIGICLIIFIQDQRQRSVSVLLFPLLMLVSGVYVLISHTFEEWLLHTAINCGFIFIQLALLTAYFSIKKRQWVNVTKGLLGWGDILFLISLCALLSPNNFFLFYIISLILIVVKELFIRFIFNKRSATIPLAGLQACLLGILMIGNIICGCLDVTTDHFLISVYG